MTNLERERGFFLCIFSEYWPNIQQHFTRRGHIRFIISSLITSPDEVSYKCGRDVEILSCSHYDTELIKTSSLRDLVAYSQNLFIMLNELNRTIMPQ